jgi:DNA-directed RNA polymerase specialized sigma24 family protein
VKRDQLPPRRPDEQKPRWSLNKGAFDKLLSNFSSDPDEAGIQYEVARRKIVRFFEWHAINRAEDYADETLNRAARRIDEGQNIDKLLAYLYGVARLILKEAIKEGERAPISLDDSPVTLREKALQLMEPDARQLCFDHCLAGLPLENRSLILNYYEEERGAKIKHRQALADGLLIPLNALRIRAHRIRKLLETCVAKCLEAGSVRNT